MNQAALLAAIGAGLMGLIKIVRTDAVQAALPEPLRWASWSKITQVGFVFAVSLAGSVATALSEGVALDLALSMGMTAALAAMGFNTAAKNVGEQLDKKE